MRPIASASAVETWHCHVSLLASRQSTIHRSLSWTTSETQQCRVSTSEIFVMALDRIGKWRRLLTFF